MNFHNIVASKAHSLEKLSGTNALSLINILEFNFRQASKEALKEHIKKHPLHFSYSLSF